MKKHQWTPEEAKYLWTHRHHKTHKEMADVLNVSVRAVAGKLNRLDALNDSPGSVPEFKPEEEDSGRLEYWRDKALSLQRDNNVLQRAKLATEILVEQATTLAPKSYSTVPPLPPPIKRGKQSPQSAVLLFSDTHIGQVVSPDQTLGLGGYDFEIFLRRLQRLQDSVTSILQDHTTTPVPEIVVAMMGDMLHGNLVHSVEAGQVNTLFDQFYSAGHAIAQFFRNLSRLAPVRVHTVVGNHPRWATQHKMPTDNRYSNLDQFLYAYVAALLRDCGRVRIILDKQPFSLFEVQGFQFYAGHGDHLRGGDKVLGIPNHAVGRNLSNTSQVFAAAGKRLPNYYMFGHMHRPITLPHASGEVIINGGFPGMDGFALMAAFNSSHPSQKFFLMHPKFGRSAAYDLRLDLGDPNPHKFTLPKEFACQ